MGSRTCILDFRYDLQTYVVWIGRLETPPVLPMEPSLEPSLVPISSSNSTTTTTTNNNNNNNIDNNNHNNNFTADDNDNGGTLLTINSTDYPLLSQPLPLPPSSPPPPSSQPQITIAITYTNRVFDDNAFGLRDVLQSVTPLLPYPIYATLLSYPIYTPFKITCGLEISDPPPPSPIYIPIQIT